MLQAIDIVVCAAATVAIAVVTDIVVVIAGKIERALKLCKLIGGRHQRGQGSGGNI